MDDKSLAVVLGLIGATCLVFGTFAPLFSVAIVSISLFGAKGGVPGVLMLLAGGLALVFSARRQFASLWYPVGIAGSVLAWMWFVAVSAGEGASLIKLSAGWGLGVLFVGLAMLTGAILFAAEGGEASDLERRNRKIALAMLTVTALANLGLKATEAMIDNTPTGPTAEELAEVEAERVRLEAEAARQEEESRRKAEDAAKEARRRQVEREMNRQASLAAAAVCQATPSLTS